MVSVIVQAKRPQVFHDEGAFDRRKYLATQGVDLVATLRSAALIERLSVAPLSAGTFLSAARHGLREEVDKLFDASAETAAVLRALEIKAGAVLKATNVDGIYDKDPRKHSDAQKFDRLDYDYCIENKLGVMDMTAFALCAENDLPIVVFSIEGEGNMRRAIFGEGIGTVVSRREE